MAEVIMNGVVDEEVNQYFHVCFFTDDKGHEPEKEDHYIFVPKSVCRVIDDCTVSVLDWYVAEKKLFKFVRGERRSMYKRIETKTKSSAAKPSSSGQWARKKPLGSFKPNKF